MTAKQSKTVSGSVFLSHSFEDKDFAERLAKRLRRFGVTVFDPGQDISAGEDWQKRILAAIRSASTVVFVIPSREGVGKNALMELGAARALGKRIVPVSPTTSRLGNAGFARVIADTAVIDASKTSENDWADALALAS
jgi:hypothetical protein